MKQHTNQRFITIGLLALILLVAFVAAHAAKDSLFTDELRSVEHMGLVRGENTLYQVTESLMRKSSQHAPGYFYLLRGWTNLVGFSPFALRYLSVLFGVLSLAMIYRLGRDIFNPSVGFYAAVLLGTNVFYHYYFHELRMYSLFSLLIILEVWLYYRVMVRETQPRWYDLLGLFLTTLGLVMTHYTSLFPLLGLGAYHLFFGRKTVRWLMTAFIVLASGITFVPWVPVAIYGMQHNSSAKPWLVGVSFFTALAEQASNGLFIIVPALLLIALLHSRQSPNRVRYIWVVLLGQVLVMFALNQYSPFMGSYRSARYYLQLYPLLFLLGAYALVALSQYRWLIPAVLAVWVIGGGLYAQTETFRYYNNRGVELEYVGYPPMSEMSETLFANGFNSRENYVVALTNHDLVWRTQYEADYWLEVLEMYGVTVDDVMLNEVKNQGDFRRLGMTEERVNIFLGYSPQQIQPETIALAQELLGTTFELCATLVENDGVVLHHYMRQPFDCTLTAMPETALVDYVEEDVLLRDMRVVVRDGYVHIAAAWALDVTVPIHAYSTSLQIFDPDGNKVSQRDYGLEHSDGYWHVVTVDAREWESGTYTIEAVVYEWQTGDRLTGDVPDGQRDDSPAAIQFEIP